jgi:hypothetical protein
VGKKSRTKGGRLERELVNLCKGMGLEAKRVPLSGAAVGYPGDIQIGDLRAEVKGRASGEGFKTLERWLGENDLLFLRRDRQKPLVLLSWPTWERLMRREAT